MCEDFPQREDSLLAEKQVKRGEQRREERSKKMRKSAKPRRQRAGEEPHYSHFLSLSRAIIKSHGLNAREHTHTHTHISLLFERKRQRARKRDRKERKSGLCVITARTN